MLRLSSPGDNELVVTASGSRHALPTCRDESVAILVTAEVRS